MKTRAFFYSVLMFVGAAFFFEGQSAAQRFVYPARADTLTERGANKMIVAELNRRFGDQGWQVSWIRQWATRITFAANGPKKGPLYTPGRTKIGWMDNRVKSHERGRQRIRIKGYRPRTPSGFPMRGRSSTRSPRW